MLTNPKINGEKYDSYQNLAEGSIHKPRIAIAAVTHVVIMKNSIRHLFINTLKLIFFHLIMFFSIMAHTVMI